LHPKGNPNKTSLAVGLFMTARLHTDRPTKVSRPADWEIGKLTGDCKMPETGESSMKVTGDTGRHLVGGGGTDQQK